MRYVAELKGKGKQIKGAAKERLGKLTGNRTLQRKGRMERVNGNVQEGIGRTRRKIGEAVAHVGGRIAGKR